MNALTTINHALAARHLLPVDGYCTCGYCMTDGLDRDQIADVPATSPIYDAVADLGGTVCTTCVDLMWLDHDNARIAATDREAHLKPCPDCEGGRKFHREWHHARKEMITHWCPTCDGRSI